MSFSLATLCFWRNVIWNRKFDVTSDVIVFFNLGKLLKQPSMLATLIFIRWVNADFICAEVFFWLEIRVSYCQVGYGVSNSGQRYTYRVLQTIQMKLIPLWVWAERAVLGSAKTALKFKYEIFKGKLTHIQFNVWGRV